MALISREFFARPSLQVAPDVLGCVIEHQTAAGLVAVELTEVEAYAGDSDPASHAYRGRTARNAVMFGPPGHAYVYFTYGMHFCANLVCLGNGSASAVLLRAGRVIEGEELAHARRAGRGGLGVGGRIAPRGGGVWGGRPTEEAEQRGSGGDRPTEKAEQRGSGGDRPTEKAEQRGSGGDRPTEKAEQRGSGGDRPTEKAEQRGSGGDRPTEKTQRVIPFRDLARGPARLCQALDIDRSQDGADVCVADSPLRVRWPEASTTRRSDKIVTGPRVGVSSAAEVPWRFWIEGEPTVSPYRRGGLGGKASPQDRGDPGGSPPGAIQLPPRDR